MVRAALIAAVYVALCFSLGFISYGPVQIRVAEALTLLPVLCPEAIVGVTLGCFIANMLTGVPLDMVVGTLATLLAAICTYMLCNVRWRGLPVLASLPPVIINAVIIGAELTYLYFPTHSPAIVWLANMGSVGAGQLISCCVLGLLLVWGIEKNSVLLKVMSG